MECGGGGVHDNPTTSEIMLIPLANGAGISKVRCLSLLLLASEEVERKVMRGD